MRETRVCLLSDRREARRTGPCRTPSGSVMKVTPSLPSPSHVADTSSDLGIIGPHSSRKMEPRQLRATQRWFRGSRRGLAALYLIPSEWYRRGIVYINMLMVSLSI